MVVAKNDVAHLHLSKQIKDRDVTKIYCALVYGAPRDTGKIDKPIGRSLSDRKKMSTAPSVGRTAITHYRVEEAFDQASLVEVRIETGRTHQIRVHMAHIAHPVVGDAVYGSRKREQALGLSAPRQMLHAARLSLAHPMTGRPLEALAAPPQDMSDLLQALRAGSSD